MEQLVIREFNQEVDLISLQAIDTSDSSEYVYEVRVEDYALILQYTTCEPALTQTFPIDLNESGIEYGLVAVIENRVVGFIGASFEEWNRQLKIRHFYVDRKYRGQGIGRMLIRSLLSYGQRIGSIMIWTETSNLNYQGIEVYKKLGFSICGFDLSMYRGTTSTHRNEFAIFLSLSTE